MKILLTGGSGFTGKRVLELLKGFDVRCLGRSEKHRELFENHGFEFVLGNVEKKEDLVRAMKGCSGLINIVSLGFGHAGNIIGAAEEVGIKRAIFVSTTAIETALNAPSKKIRLAAEKRIKESCLDWTIIRPTMIFGAPDDRNIWRLVRYLKKWPVIFIPGSGKSLQQPVYVNDLAFAIKSSFFCEKSLKKTYNISGKEPLSFKSLISSVESLLGKNRVKICLPVTPVALILGFFESLKLRLPIKKEQILRLLEDKVFDHQLAIDDFNYDPKTFKEALEEASRVSKNINGI